MCIYVQHTIKRQTKIICLFTICFFFFLIHTYMYRVVLLLSTDMCAQYYCKSLIYCVDLTLALFVCFFFFFYFFFSSFGFVSSFFVWNQKSKKKFNIFFFYLISFLLAPSIVLSFPIGFVALKYALEIWI